jgi:hypothetical protein
MTAKTKARTNAKSNGNGKKHNAGVLPHSTSLRVRMTRVGCMSGGGALVEFVSGVR